MSLAKNFGSFELGKSEPVIGNLVDFLLVHSPDRAKLQDPPPDCRFKGYYSSIEIQECIHFFSCDITFSHDHDMRGSMPAGLWVGALFLGDHETTFGNQLVRFRGNGNPKLLTFGEGTEYKDLFYKNRTIRMSSFFVGKAFFEESGSQSEQTPIEMINTLIKPGMSQLPINNPGAIGKHLLRLMQNPYQGHVARLFRESTVLACLFELAQTLKDASASREAPRSDQRMLALEACHFIDNEPDQFDSVVALAKKLGTNETTLQREFKLHTGQTIFQYALQRRMQAARILIRDHKLAISQIAYRVGYSSPANFSTAYKRFYGHSPAEE